MQVITILLTGAISILLVSACVNQTEAQQESSAAPATQASHGSTATTADPWGFLNQLKSTKTFKGDFNGDGRTDTLIAVPSREIKAVQLPATLHAAWPYYGEQSTPPDLLNGGQIALVVGESYPDQRQFHIIFDPNSISILATEAAEGMFVVPSKDKQNSAWQEVGNHAKGDLLVIPTEAGIDSYLFWDGTGYRSLEVFEMP
jgi:hypothetical protein